MNFTTTCNDGLRNGASEGHGVLSLDIDNRRDSTFGHDLLDLKQWALYRSFAGAVSRFWSGCQEARIIPSLSRLRIRSEICSHRQSSTIRRTGTMLDVLPKFADLLD
jgi:hypothetical protein